MSAQLARSHTGQIPKQARKIPLLTAPGNLFHLDFKNTYTLV